MRLFVTGTGTGVGKTTVSCAVLGAAHARGMTVAASKPAESGCEVRAGALWPSDAAALRAAVGHAQALAEICPYRYEEAVAPGVAAARTGDVPSLDELAAACERVVERGADLTLVEGAGGLLVPLSGEHLVADLALRLEMPVLVVGLAGLGTINHSLLTLEALRARGLEVAGLVLNDAVGTTSPQAAASNCDEIRRASGVEILGVLPHCSEGGLDELAAAAERHLALDRLFHVER